MSEKVSRRGFFSQVALGAVAAGLVGAVGYEAHILLRRRSTDEMYGAYPDANLLSLPQVVNPAAEKPNVIVILCDDLGYADLGCYGSTAIKTPNIDALAKTGAKLAQFYVQPMCTPTRAARVCCAST